MICTKCGKEISASEYVKAKGLVNLNQLIAISGRDRSTLNRWFNEDLPWFKIVVDGVLFGMTYKESDKQ